MGELYRDPIHPQKAQKALSSYIKALIQDYYNETGQHIEEIRVSAGIDGTTNKWQVKDVEILSDMQMPLLNI